MTQCQEWESLYATTMIQSFTLPTSILKVCYNSFVIKSNCSYSNYLFADYQPLRFTDNLPNNTTLLYNNTDPILLTCTVPLSMATTKLYWMLNNEVLNTDLVKRVNVPNVIHKQSEMELQLLITSPIPSVDTGVYTCVAENEWERIERHTSIRFDISNGKHLKMC